VQGAGLASLLLAKNSRGMHDHSQQATNQTELQRVGV